MWGGKRPLCALGVPPVDGPEGYRRVRTRALLVPIARLRARGEGTAGCGRKTKKQIYMLATLRDKYVSNTTPHEPPSSGKVHTQLISCVCLPSACSTRQAPPYHGRATRVPRGRPPPPHRMAVRPWKSSMEELSEASPLVLGPGNTFQKRSVSSPAPVTIVCPSGDMAR